MPAYDAGRYVREAIESVLSQEGIDFELIVVDDGSADDTPEVVESFADPRVRLIRHHRNLGIGRAHNRVLAGSHAPFIAHVDADDVVLPGAFRRMLAAFEDSPRVGLAHCHYLLIDRHGTVRGDSARSVSPGVDYRRELLVRGGSIANHLRTYRREALEAVGPFDERGGVGVDSEMALRILDRYEIRLVPEVLYALRLHGSNTCQSMPFKEVRLWYRRAANARRLVRSGQVRYLRGREHGLNRLMVAGLRHALAAAAWRLVPGVLWRASRIFSASFSGAGRAGRGGPPAPP
jgi:glycosyltransferase involved in cell wall biosynthesis